MKTETVYRLSKGDGDQSFVLRHAIQCGLLEPLQIADDGEYFKVTKWAKDTDDNDIRHLSRAEEWEAVSVEVKEPIENKRLFVQKESPNIMKFSNIQDPSNFNTSEGYGVIDYEHVLLKVGDVIKEGDEYYETDHFKWEKQTVFGGKVISNHTPIRRLVSAPEKRPLHYRQQQEIEELQKKVEDLEGKLKFQSANEVSIESLNRDIDELKETISAQKAEIEAAQEIVRKTTTKAGNLYNKTVIQKEELDRLKDCQEHFSKFLEEQLGVEEVNMQSVMDAISKLKSTSNVQWEKYVLPIPPIPKGFVRFYMGHPETHHYMDVIDPRPQEDPAQEAWEKSGNKLPPLTDRGFFEAGYNACLKKEGGG